jgi:hypothetical protein
VEILKQASNISKFIVLGLHSDLCWLRHLQVLGNSVSGNA